MVWYSVDFLKSADNEEESHHEKGADKHSWSTAESIEIDNGRESEGNIQNILDRGSEKWRGDVGSFHDV